MKIAIPVLSFTRSGGARVLSELASAWCRDGHEVSFLCAQGDSEPHFPTLARVVAGRALSTTAGLAGRMLELRRMAAEAAPGLDILMPSFHLAVWATWAAGRAARARAFYYMQAYEAEFYTDHASRWRGALLSALARHSYRVVPRVVTNAPMYLDYPGISAIGWVPPGIDFARFFARPAHPWPRERAPVLGCIGRPERWKGTHDVFAAAALLAAQGRDFVLRCAFHRPEGFEALGERVQQVQPRNDDELAEFYRSCDLMLAPGTIQLGAPHYPVMEAMACGVPVITTGYMPADADNALIVPIGDPAALAAAVESALADPAATAARAARARQSIAEFAWPVVARRFLGLFEGAGARAIAG
jgi:glycosyltransferase involved in cell wall biosynthesis